MIALHEDHQVGKTDKDMKLKAATQHVADTMARAHAQENKRANPVTTNERANKRCGESGRLWTTTQREIGIFVAQWLVSAGLPYNTVTTEDFKLLIQRLTGDPSATMLAASTFRDLLAALFAKFCEATKALLLREHKAAHGLPFLNLHHDGWTTGNGNVAALGTSVSFIDRSWQHREIALLLTVGHSSHAAFDVKKMICTRTLDVYGIDINEMVQFSVSDTASAARKVSKLSEESTQTDCSMHVLNLCLQYAMGLRENKETIEVYDPVTDTRKREQRYCTVGGAFEEGRDLIKNVRALNNYFSTQLRCKRLEDVQEFFKLPELKTMVDSDTRVGFTLKLFQRTIVNYKAFSVYFQKCEKGDDASVFDRLTLVEWRLLVEMEAICRPIGDLARGAFSVCDLEAPRTTTTTVKSFPRFDVLATDLTPLAQTCLARMKGQVKQRIANVTAETVMILLLDPRTKSSIESLVRSPFQSDDVSEGVAVTEEVDTEFIVEAGKQLLRDAHREVYCALNRASRGTDQSEAANAAPNLDLVPCAEDDKMICGAAIPMTTAGTTSLSTLHDQADKILEKWQQLAVDWVAVTLHQAPANTASMDWLTPVLMVRRNGIYCWNVEAVCKHVNILRWFREIGSTLFPSVAALARVWLGRSPSNAFHERVFFYWRHRDEQPAHPNGQ